MGRLRDALIGLDEQTRAEVRAALQVAMDARQGEEDRAVVRLGLALSRLLEVAVFRVEELRILAWTLGLGVFLMGLLCGAALSLLLCCAL